MYDNLSSIRDEEDEARDNMPENLQDSDKYSESEECSDKMQDALDSGEEAVSVLEELEG